ncbi:MAG: phytanoyl-CoA dioxygenase family protein [Methylophilus sp.]|nr:phytanoyl-CoA dioxygenase family protein [Methylophilus sp.]MDP3608521.1 phytanoyl-CoA dioxygenase family protein [Methylophilus sp.]
MSSAAKSLDYTNLKKQFSENGYVLLKQFFSDAQMPALLDAIQKAKPAEGQGGLSKGTMQFRSNLFYNSPFIQSFISQQKVVDFLQNIIGKDFWIRWDQAVGKGPRSPVFPWHQDNGYNELACEHFQFWIAVTKSTAENGTIVIVPKSHLNGRLGHYYDGKHTCYTGNVKDEIMIEAEAGDVLLFSSLTLHKTLPNITDDDIRWAYVLEFMSIEDYDPSVPSPYFQVSKEGKPFGQFIQQHPAKSILTDLQYHLKKLKGPLRAASNKLKSLGSTRVPSST